MLCWASTTNMDYRLQVRCIYFICLIMVVNCQYKRWKKNTNFENAENWSGGKSPCHNDRVSFPGTIPSVYVQTNTTVLEIILPTDGEIVFGEFSSISFQEEANDDEGCPGTELRYSRTGAMDWLDADNWCVSAGSGGDCLSQQPSLLETERLPCQYEGVVFPPDSSFLVGLGSDVSITVAGLTLTGQDYSTSTFQDLLSSPEGQKMFSRTAGVVPTSVTVTGDIGCKDETGCLCGNHGLLGDRICAIEKLRCSIPDCSRPLLPIGGCCTICGVIFTLDYGAGFKLSRLSTYLQEEYSTQKVKLTVSKIPGDKIQIAVMDDADGLPASNAGKLIQEALKNDIQKEKLFGVTKMDVKYSIENQKAQISQKQVAGAVSRGGIAGIAVGICVFLIIIVFLILCFLGRQRSLNAWYTVKGSVKSRFRRFTNGSDTEMGTSSESVHFDNTGRGFDNPMYGATGTLQPGRDTEGGASPTSVEPSSPLDSPPIVMSDPSTRPTSFDNPLYGAVGPVQEIPREFLADPTIKMNPVFKLGEMEIAESEI